MILEANLHWRYVDTVSNLIMPWYTLPALQWIKEQDVSNWNVFEYGCGYSTIWWRLNCRSIRSVDSDEGWATAMNAHFIRRKDLYIQSCNRMFDCIIIDGEHREECTNFCLPYLKSGGCLIIDNWEETEGFDCSKIKEFLGDWQYTVHQQPNHSDWRTAIFIKP